MLIEMWFLLAVLIFCFNIIGLTNCETKCNFLNCEECIGNEDDLCVWCLDENMKDESKRCQTQDYALSNKLWCDNKYDPKPMTLEIISNISSEKDRQLYPQSMKIHSRSGVPVDFTISYRSDNNYPVDVYFLVDFTYSMDKHKATLGSKAFQIYSKLSELSNNVRLGVGSFAEKPALPYSSPECKAYSFKNDIPLTKNVSAIKEFLASSTSIDDNDNQEATLDALMQAMVCQKEVGWRKEARRIIVVYTDGSYHSAGDGKMVGAIKPNDMKCHLHNQVHTSSLEYDYPSVSQINRVAMDNNITIIFAVTNTYKNDYELLAKQIQGAQCIEIRDKHIGEIIPDEYKDISKSVQFSIETPSNIKVNLNPDCSTNKCYVNKNQTIDINVTVKVKFCPKITNKESEIRIAALGLDEILLIDHVAICKCDCQQQITENATECNNYGSYQCGVCKCNNKRYGDKCQCTGLSMNAELSKCKADVDVNNVCSGSGICRCGECVCQEPFYGKFCENDAHACPLYDGKVCAGHGFCANERCKCDHEWTGADCHCPDHDRWCYAPTSNEVCSGNGKCNCGECSCEKSYSGIFCDDCENCQEKHCKELQSYAQCNFMKKHIECFNKFNQKASFIDVKLVNSTEFHATSLSGKCEAEETDGSKILFKYQIKSKTQMLLLIQNTLELPPKVHTWVIVGSIIGSVLFVGILTGIIWKVSIDYRDYKAYKKFEEQANTGDLVANPLYKHPCVHYRNPHYNASD